MTGKPEKPKQTDPKPAPVAAADKATETAAAAPQENAPAIQKGLGAGEKVQVPPIHVHGQAPEPAYVALAKIRCECLKLATDPNAYDQRPRVVKAQEFYDWVIDSERRFEDMKPKVVETKPVDHSAGNLPEEDRIARGAQAAGEKPVDWSNANVR